MIDGKQLRIGNLVNYRDESHVFEVLEVHATGIRVKDSEQKTWIEYDCFDPIPLTEEWLLRFGFNKLCDNDFRIGLCTGDGADLSIELVDTEACIVRQHISDGVVGNDFDYAYIAPIKFVHQLQNLYFALTQKETELKP